MRKVRPGTATAWQALRTLHGAILAAALVPVPAGAVASALTARRHDPAAACALRPPPPPYRADAAGSRPNGHADQMRCTTRRAAAPASDRAGGDARERTWMLAAALAVLCGGGLTPVLRRWRRRRRRSRALRLIRAEIDRQAVRLRIRRLQLLVADEYGTVRADRWEREKRRFCESRLRPILLRVGLDRLWPAVRNSALRRIERAAGRRPPGARGFDPAMHPLDYERFCARLLEGAGWTTRLTPASGDQGADILAERGGRLLVVQCKLYRNAVGNDAVQQVAAARAHQGAQVAIVVSNARFTAAARALARSNRVELLHHEELAGFRPDQAAATADRSGDAPRRTIASATR